MRDFVQIAIDYARAAVDRKNKQYGKWIRLAAERFLADLKRAETGTDFIFSAGHAEHACRFVEMLHHVEGQWTHPETGEPLETIYLHPAQVWFLVQLFGFRRNNGMRRFTTALFGIARKGAKSTLAAAILIYCFTSEGEVGPQIITAAGTGDQARIIFNIAKRMVEKSAELREAFGLECFANALVNHSVGGTFKPINAKASTQDGLNPSACGLDEIHAHKSPDLLNVLKSAAGARQQPLFLYTTTEGYPNAGPWADIRHFAKIVLDGAVSADHFLAAYFTIDDEDSEFDEKCWIKANPLIDVNPILLDEIRKEAVEARQMPSRLAEFRIKRCMRPSEAANCAIDLRKWKLCGGEVPLDRLRTVPCYAGLDLANTTDMNALALLWRLESRLYVVVRYWVPRYAVQQRNERGTLKYQPWVDSGHIKVTEGETADYETIDADIGVLMRQFNIRKMAYDAWNSSSMVPMLQRRNLPVLAFEQQARMYHPAIREIETAYVGGLLVHGNNPVLNWNAANLIFRTDVNMNNAPDRKRCPDKIDGMAALFMAGGAMLSEPVQQGPGRVYAL